MAVGLPVLATPAGSLEELAANGVLQVVPPGEPVGLAMAIRAVLDDDLEASRLRVAGAAFAAAHTRPAEARRLVDRWRSRWPGLPWDSTAPTPR